ncbi:MAG: DUF4350 domain-containing protein [Planctomycetota bacterium]|nr:DUF4350 domain-containing protein [Planctomycetota bacterium]
MLLVSTSIYPGCTTIESGQIVDKDFEPIVERPAYPRGEGPVVLIDAAHGNFHTLDGRYRAFGRLLELDGCDVRSADSQVTPELLRDADVFVISNALKGGADAEWVLPTPSAFTSGEIEYLRAWVDKGGSLLLIADHMPMPGATADLAKAFGFLFHNGFAFKTGTRQGTFHYTRSEGSLAEHAITEGRDAGERIESVMVFTGQAFESSDGIEDIEPLFRVFDDMEVLLPERAWEFSDETPRIPATGMYQGAVRRYGSGRFAVFGEAAMFTAQQQVRDGNVRYMGLNHPEAPDNQQFVLNVIHWLTGELDH